MTQLRVISLGAGVQSTTMALMAAHGEIGPMPDCAIFADTQGEPAAVYKHLDWLRSPGVLPFPVHIVTKGSLWESATKVRTTKDGKRSYIETAIPVFLTEGLSKGLGKRHCTRDFKISPVTSKMRRLLGRRSIRATEGRLVEMWMGISVDEAIRKRPSREPWIETRWPLLEKFISRTDCLNWMSKRGYPIPPKSACTFCPFHDDKMWTSLEPEEFDDVCRKETELQAAYSAASEMRGVPYFHASLAPLDKVDFLNWKQPGQIDMFNNECEGFCGI